MLEGGVHTVHALDYGEAGALYLHGLAERHRAAVELADLHILTARDGECDLFNESLAVEVSSDLGEASARSLLRAEEVVVNVDNGASVHAVEKLCERGFARGGTTFDGEGDVPFCEGFVNLDEQRQKRDEFV